ncbi:MAG: serine hydrolase [Chthoniobacter sp.]
MFSRFCLSLSFLLLTAAWSPADSLRLWTDRNSNRTWVAELLKAADGVATLRGQNGQILSVPVASLSNSDQEYLARQHAGVQTSAATAWSSAEPAKRGRMRDRFDIVPAFSAEKIPLQGLADPRLAAVDEAVRKTMAEHGFVAVSFAVAKGGVLLHERAFGWGDADLKTPFPTGLAMRLASISKPLTAAGIYTLVEQGKLKLTDKVATVLNLHHPGMDPRWKEITIQHLLLHQGGWDRNQSGDFAYQSDVVCHDLRIPLARMKPDDLVKWALDKRLDFDPGARSEYSNFGYILLARVIEKLSGQSFVDALNSTIGRESGMTTLLLSRSDARDRTPRETWYCYHPEVPRPVDLLPVRHEAMDGSADLACSAADYCRFLSHYSITGRKLADSPGKYVFFGSTYGCLSVCVQYPNGVCFAAISNRRIPTEPEGSYKSVIDLMDSLNGQL